jgi:hypothetical protein
MFKVQKNIIRIIAGCRSTDSRRDLFKNIIRIIAGCRSTDSRRDLFKTIKILPLKLQYILSLLLFVVTYSMEQSLS